MYPSEYDAYSRRPSAAFGLYNSNAELGININNIPSIWINNEKLPDFEEIGKARSRAAKFVNNIDFLCAYNNIDDTIV